MITLVGDGISYTVPSTIDLREYAQSIRNPSLGQVLGARGEIPSPFRQEDIITLRLEGWLVGTSASATEAEYRLLRRALHARSLTIHDTISGRTGRVRVGTVRVDRPAGPATRMFISADLVVVDGSWRAPIADAPTVASETITYAGVTPVRRLVVFDLVGSAPVRPIVQLILRSTAGMSTEWFDSVRYYGGNLVRNPSFEALYGGWPQYWVSGGGVARVVRDRGRTTATSVYADSSGGTGWWGQYDIPVNGGRTYTASAYFLPAGSATGRVKVEWRDVNGAYISDDASVGSLGAGWTRVTHTRTAPVGAYTARLFVHYGAGEGYITDVQFEERSTASTFFSTPPKILTRGQALRWVSGHRRYVIDMARGRASVMMDTGIWVTDTHLLTRAEFFDLVPLDGSQHIQIDSPSFYFLDVQVLYAPQYW